MATDRFTDSSTWNRRLGMYRTVRVPDRPEAIFLLLRLAHDGDANVGNPEVGRDVHAGDRNHRQARVAQARHKFSGDDLLDDAGHPQEPPAFRAAAHRHPL
jgi:hypothetical protein